MRFSESVDDFVADMFATQRFNSPATEEGYRYTLERLAEHVGNRDPRKVGRADVKGFLANWTHPNTRATHHAHVASFFRWCMEEGLRKDNPALQVRRSRTRAPSVYRLTREEVRAFRQAPRDDRERAIADLGLLVGLRAKEILGMQGRHFRRPGWVWVSADIAKGGRERWVRALPEFEPTWARLSGLEDDYYAFPKRQFFVAGFERRDTIFWGQASSYDALYRMTIRIGARAGIRAQITPHMLRHAYADHIARFAGIRVAQSQLGHLSVKTTERYLGGVTLDEIAEAMVGFGYGYGGLPPEDSPASAVVEPTVALYPEYRPWDWERASRALGAVLVALRDNPAIREAARVHA